MKIAVYDSGLGGLWILYSLIEKYPNHHYVYLGDQLNAPYGSKNIDTLKPLIKENFSWLKNQGVQRIVVACNTICSVGAIDFDVAGVKIEGIIDKTIQQIDANVYSKILVLATPVTIESGMYQKKLKSMTNEVYGLALDNLANLLEEQVSMDIISNYLKKEFSKLVFQPDAIVLGCTHYPFVQDLIESYFKVPVFNSNNLEFDFDKESKPQLEIYTSKNTKVFQEEILSLFNRKEKVFFKNENCHSIR